MTKTIFIKYEFKKIIEMTRVDSLSLSLSLHFLFSHHHRRNDDDDARVNAFRLTLSKFKFFSRGKQKKTKRRGNDFCFIDKRIVFSTWSDFS